MKASKIRSPASVPTLFDAGAVRDTPLAERMRPLGLHEVAGQQHLLAEGSALRTALDADRLPSLILWGPPGIGKTSLATVLARTTKAEFVAFSAVLGSLPELRVILNEAKDRRSFQQKRTLLFVDEIHRFHKGQQDAFLPHVEAGIVTLVGATTENPSFALNAALLSRCRVLKLHPLEPEDIRRVLSRALADRQRGLGELGLTAEEAALDALATMADGDVRKALSLLEQAAVDIAARKQTALQLADVERYRGPRALRYDRAGEEHYGLASAFIKSMRGTDPDAALYWATRMLEGGEDPNFVLRRMVIFASEDIGNADPRALHVALNADAAFRRLGPPEGYYAIAQAIAYLASAPKSNASYVAWHRSRTLVEKFGAVRPAKHLLPASSSAADAERHGAGYIYPHDEEGGVAWGQHYLPDELQRGIEAQGHAYLYEPKQRGEEVKIAARLDVVRKARKPQ
jgi:putative ATPase